MSVKMCPTTLDFLNVIWFVITMYASLMLHASFVYLVYVVCDVLYTLIVRTAYDVNTT